MYCVDSFLNILFGIIIVFCKFRIYLLVDNYINFFVA